MSHATHFRVRINDPDPSYCVYLADLVSTLSTDKLDPLVVNVWSNWLRFTGSLVDAVDLSYSYHGSIYSMEVTDNPVGSSANVLKAYDAAMKGLF